MNTEYSDVEEQGGGGFFSHLPAIFWQRRWWIIVPFIVIGLASFGAAYLMPTVYRSSAVLLVESQELPENLVGSPVTAVIDERVARIEQQVLSRGDLIALIQQNGLYEEERQTQPLSRIVETMRENTRLGAVGTDLAKRPGESNTIAFSISFDYRDPVKAQSVVQSYVDSFLQLSATQTAEQAESTVAFLDSQATELQRQIAEVEGQITAMKAENGSVLARAGLGGSANPGSYDAQIAALQKENIILAQEARESQQNTIVGAAAANLAAARAIYADSHPDVQLALQRLQEARRLAAAGSGTNAAMAGAAARIAANNAQIAALGRARAEEQARSSSSIAAQARIPLVMEQIAQAESRASTLRDQYRDVSGRLLSARNSLRMESQDQGERLSVSDPPVVPDRPISMNPLLVIAGGWALGAFVGLVLAIVVELIMRPIRGAEAIERLLGVPPLAVVPTIHHHSSFMQRASRRLAGRRGRNSRYRQRRLSN